MLILQFHTLKMLKCLFYNNIDQIFEKKTGQKAVFGHFVEKFDRKIAIFFWRTLPLKVSIYWRPGGFRKILGSVGQKWIS